MKTLKLKSVLFGLVAIMAISITLVSCEQDELALLDPSTVELVEITDNTSEENRLFYTPPPHNPCGQDAGVIMPTVNSQAQCNLYWGTIWYNGSCYWCY